MTKNQSIFLAQEISANERHPLVRALNQRPAGPGPQRIGAMRDRQTQARQRRVTGKR